MNVTFKMGELVNGFKVVERNGLSRFVVENDKVRIAFDTEAGAGRNYSKIVSYYDKRTNRSYRGMRYLIKYVSLVQSFSNVLFQKYQANNN